MLNGTEITTLGGQAVAVAAIIGTMWKWVKKNAPGTATVVEHEAATLESKIPDWAKALGEDAVQFVENLAKSPAFAAKAAAGELKAQHVIDTLSHSTAVSEAKTVLLTIGKAYNALSDTEKVKAEVNLRLALSRLGMNFTDSETKHLFAEVQTAMDALSNDATFKATFPDDTLASA